MFLKEKEFAFTPCFVKTCITDSREMTLEPPGATEGSFNCRFIERFVKEQLSIN